MRTAFLALLVFLAGCYVLGGSPIAGEWAATWLRLNLESETPPEGAEATFTFARGGAVVGRDEIGGTCAGTYRLRGRDRVQFALTCSAEASPWLRSVTDVLAQTSTYRRMDESLWFEVGAPLPLLSSGVGFTSAGAR